MPLLFDMKEVESVLLPRSKRKRFPSEPALRERVAEMSVTDTTG